jgi:hypothetical protein
MPDDTMASPPDLGDDLRRYFAITTGTELPRRVREMSARTLRPRRRSYGPLLSGGGAVLAAAALAVVVVGLHHGAGGGGSTASGVAERPANSAPQTTITYPGVNISVLAPAGDTLQPPAGHGTARVSAVAAQAAAAAQGGAGLPGPAVLSWARLADTSPPITCLCWVVEVPIAGGAVSGVPAPVPPTHNMLVLVDATTGRIVDTLAAPGP